MSEEPAEYEVSAPFTEATEAERVCSIPNADLMGFASDLKMLSTCSPAEVKRRTANLVARFKMIKSALNVFNATTNREKIQRARANQGSISHAGDFTKLESVFADIENSNSDANEVFALKLKAFKEHGIDLLQLARALDAMVKDGKVDAAKLSVQLVGLLTEQDRAETPPVFNFNTIIVENPEQLKRMVG